MFIYSVANQRRSEISISPLGMSTELYRSHPVLYWLQYKKLSLSLTSSDSNSTGQDPGDPFTSVKNIP